MVVVVVVVVVVAVVLVGGGEAGWSCIGWSGSGRVSFSAMEVEVGFGEEAGGNSRGLIFW